jgi:MoaA/NifB/PqqE/SkfB family radical SAM enzyme
MLKKLYIEPTSKCNLSCTMCFRKTWFDESFSDMDLGAFDRIMETMPGSVETVFFGGMGEPLYHKDIAYMVKSAAAKRVKVELLTNGTLLTHEMSCRLLDAGLSVLWVSMDSFESDTYEKIRRNSNFSLVNHHIQKYNLERTKRESRAELGIAFVAMKSNVRQLGMLGRFASMNHVGRINISNVIPTDRSSWDEGLYSRVVSL